MRNACLLAVLLLGCRSTEPGTQPCGECPPATAAAEPGPRGDASPRLDESADSSEDEDDDEFDIAVGDCDTRWLPASLVSDVPAKDTEELVEFLSDWLADEGASSNAGPVIESRRGIAFAKSEDHAGADPPLANRTKAQSTLACGLSSVWLRSHLRATLAEFEVRCRRNVCCYAGSAESTSDGVVVFRRATAGLPAPSWAVAAAGEYGRATIDEAHVAANRKTVAQGLERVQKGKCAGEPAGYQ
jgi:hypothetical protein